MSDAISSNPKTFRELCDEWVKADQKENGQMPINLKIAAGTFARWLDKRGLSVETECVGSGDPANCPENEGRGCCQPNPVAWRKLINSPYERHPRYGYSEEALEGGEPLYTRSPVKSKENETGSLG